MLGFATCLSALAASSTKTFRLVDYYYPPQVGATWLYQGPNWQDGTTHTRVQMTHTNFSITVYNPTPYSQEVLRLNSDYGYFSGGAFIPTDNWQDYPSVQNGFAFYGFDDDSDSGRVVMIPFPEEIAVGKAVTRKGTMYDRDGNSLGSVSFSLQLLDQTSVTVPAGTFPDCLHLRMTLSAGGQNQVQEIWWALGIGQVRNTRISGYDPEDNNGGYLEELVSTTATADWAPTSLAGYTLNFTIPGEGSGAIAFDVSTFTRTGYHAGAGSYTYTRMDGLRAQFSELDMSPPEYQGNQSKVELSFAGSKAGTFVSHWHDAGGDSGTTSGTFSLVMASPLVVNVVGAGTLTPDYTGQILEVGKTYALSVKAAKGYTFRGWTGGVTSSSTKLSFVMQPGLELTATFADTTAPKLKVVSPKKKATVSTELITVMGTASDNGPLASVQCQLNGGAWTAATGTTSWQTELHLVAGVNTIKVYAADAAGNVSTTSTLVVTYTATGPRPESLVAVGEAPELSICREGNQIRVSWPTDAVGYSLEFSKALDESAAWTPVNNLPSEVDGQNEVLDQLDDGPRFYRLKK